MKAVRDENGMEWKGNGNGNGNGNGMKVEWKWKWKWKWNANAVVSAAKASDAQALASLDRSQWPVASGQWRVASGISHSFRLLAHGDGQTKCELHGSGPFMHDWIEHETERKIGIGAKQACQAAKWACLCGMWRRKATFYGYRCTMQVNRLNRVESSRVESSQA